MIKRKKKNINSENQECRNMRDWGRYITRFSL